MRQAITDTVLVRRAAEGDAIAFSELVTRHYAFTLRVAWGMLQTREDAEGVVQKTFARVHHRLEGFTCELEFRAWLYRFITQQAMQEMQCKQRLPVRRHPACAAGMLVQAGQQTLCERTSLDMPTGREGRVRLGQALQQALLAQPVLGRAVLVLRDVGGFRYDEIAYFTGEGRAQVQAHLHAARRALRLTLAADWAPVAALHMRHPGVHS